MDVQTEARNRGRRRLALAALGAAVALIATGCPREAPRPCGDDGRWDGLEPLARGDGPIAALSVTSDTPGSIAESENLYVRIAFAEDAPRHLLFVDVDGDRMTGMWTFQSPVSGAGWDVLIDEKGGLYRHEGPPNAWNWVPDDDPGYGRTVRSGVADVCIPVRVLARGGPPPGRIRLGAMVDRGDGDTAWLPLAFLPGVPYPNLAEADPGEPIRPLASLAFMYAHDPWVVRHCTDPSPASMGCPAAVYGRFEHVVFGAGLEDPGHPSHPGTARLIGEIRDRFPETEVWGYVSMIGRPDFDGDGRRDDVYTVEAIAQHAERWRAMGATGVFLDEDGLCDPAWSDCPVGPEGAEVALSRERQVRVARAIHGMGLAVFANAFSVEDLLAPLHGVPTPLGGARDGRPADMYLIENPTIAAGAWRSGLDYDVSVAKFEMAMRLRRETGVRIAAVDTLAGPVPDGADELPEYRAAWWRAAQANLDAYGFTNAGYSAPTELATNLALLDPPPDAREGYGKAFEPGGLQISRNGWETVRYALNGSGERTGFIRFTRLSVDGVAEAAFVPLG